MILKRQLWRAFQLYSTPIQSGTLPSMKNVFFIKPRWFDEHTTSNQLLGNHIGASEGCRHGTIDPNFDALPLAGIGTHTNTLLFLRRSSCQTRVIVANDSNVLHDNIRRQWFKLTNGLRWSIMVGDHCRWCSSPLLEMTAMLIRLSIVHSIHPI